MKRGQRKIWEKNGFTGDWNKIKVVIYCKDIQYDENMKKREKKIIKGEKKKDEGEGGYGKGGKNFILMERRSDEKKRGKVSKNDEKRTEKWRKEKYLLSFWKKLNINFFLMFTRTDKSATDWILYVYKDKFGWLI